MSTEVGLHLEVQAMGLMPHGQTTVRINGIDVTNATRSIRLEMAVGEITLAHMTFLVRKLDADVRALVVPTFDPIASHVEDAVTKVAS